MPGVFDREVDVSGSQAASLLGEKGEEGPYLSQDLEKDLLRHGVKLYGAGWCGMCRSQKALLYHLSPTYWKRMYVDCDYLLNALETSFVRKVPTWKVGGHWYEGSQSEESLRLLLDSASKRECRLGGSEDRRRHHRRAKWAKYDYAFAVRRSVLKVKKATAALVVENFGDGSVEATAAAIAKRQAVLGARSGSVSPKQETSRPTQQTISQRDDNHSPSSITEQLRVLSVNAPMAASSEPPTPSGGDALSVHNFIRDAFRGGSFGSGRTPTKLSPKFGPPRVVGASSFHFPSPSIFTSTDIIASATNHWTRGPSRLLTNCSWFQQRHGYAVAQQQESVQQPGSHKGKIMKLWTNFSNRHCI